MRNLSILAVAMYGGMILAPTAVLGSPAGPPGGIDVNIASPVPVPVTVDGQTSITGDVNVINTPDVNVKNLPAVQDVNVVDGSHIQATASVTTGNDIAAAYIRPAVVAAGSCTPSGGCDRVPAGYKLVITDFVLNHAGLDTSGTLGANIGSSEPNQNCSDGKSTLVQFRVGQDASAVVNPSTIANFTTGYEFREGTQVCVLTGGGTVALSYQMSGYLTPTSAGQ
jgi:hypothetical protein